MPEEFWKLLRLENISLCSETRQAGIAAPLFGIGACIEAFQHCRPIICIDRTFLTGKYKGTILTAIAAGGNNQLLPLAIAFVEKES